MRLLFSKICFSAAAVLVAGAANANEELIKMSQNPKDWVMPTGNYANHRYSRLNQITSENAAKLQVTWTFSTGVLRGHEGGPLVIGNVMFVHGPFPNPVFALDLNNDGKILWKYDPRQDPDVITVMCCDTVNRGLAYADGNVTTYEHNGKQHIAVLSGVGGWAGIGLAAGLTEPTAGLGAVGGYAGLHNYTALGGQLTVFSLPDR